jgi:2-polyprenyl-3-methyl-5-hydroxy-6-metoxy-1,4-benzoquinol methylase
LTASRTDHQPARHAAAWAEAVRSEHEQADRVRASAAESDYWKPFAHRFHAASGGDGGGDPGLGTLLDLVRPEHTVLDVGAGAGRIALPAAKKCRRVTAVEPSKAMRERLAAQMAEWGVTNLDVVASTWEEAVAPVADVVICSHVLYTVADPVAFVRKLEAHARVVVAVVMFDQPAAHAFFPLWPAVHGEERISLPCLPEFRLLLDEMGVRYNASRLPRREPRGFESTDQAIAEATARLFVAPGSPKAAKLEAAVRSSLVPADGGVRFKWASAQQPWLVTWKPATGNA